MPVVFVLEFAAFALPGMLGAAFGSLGNSLMFSSGICFCCGDDDDGIIPAFCEGYKWLVT